MFTNSNIQSEADTDAVGLSLGTHWNIFLLLFVVYSSVFALSLSTVLTLVFSLSLLFSPYRSQSINISIAFISFLF